MQTTVSTKNLQKADRVETALSTILGTWEYCGAQTRKPLGYKQYGRSCM